MGHIEVGSPFHRTQRRDIMVDLHTQRPRVAQGRLGDDERTCEVETGATLGI